LNAFPDAAGTLHLAASDFTEAVVARDVRDDSR
jgi:hypothetical protein